jgi:tetratricopeptide (TPR) repeat protein
MILSAVLAAAASLAAAQDNLLEMDASRRLGVAWGRAAVTLVADTSLPDPASFEGALDVALAAAELAPENPQGWRTVVAIAELAPDDSPKAGPAMARALKEIHRLDPADGTVQLARLTDAAERGTVADERVKAFEQLLSPQALKKLAPPVAARLAFDLALLQKRRGESQAWVRWLREACTLDPAFPIATETLAGVEAGLGSPLEAVSKALVDAVTADPGNIPSLNALARICLHEGLYVEADTLLELAARVAALDLDFRVIDDIVADRVIALWGQGRHADAAKVADARQAELNAMLRRRLGEATATTTQEDVNQGPTVTLPSSLASVRAALARSAGLPGADAAMALALRSLDDERTLAGPDAKAQAAIDLQKAWLQVTVGDFATVSELLASVEKEAPLTDQAKARFDGWLKLRRNENDAALAALQPIADRDPGAKLGTGMALEALGRPKDAARVYLAVIQENRDSVVGVYAADRLHGLVKARPGPTAEAKAVQKALARLPQSVPALLNDQRQALSCTLSFGNPSTTLDSLPVTISIQNRTSLPLEITPIGPIESRAALLLSAAVVGQRPISLTPWIFALDRRIQLKPLETLSFESDMARTPLGQVLLGDPLSGALIDATLVTNFRLTAERVQAGFMGNLSPSAILRIPAVQVDAAWREDALGEIRQIDRPEDLMKMVLLAYDLVARAAKGEADLEPSWKVVTDAWVALPPVAQAWTLMVLPKGRLEPMAPILDAAKVSTDERVRMSYLLRWVESPDDVQLTAAERLGGRIASVSAGVRGLLRAKARDQADVSQELGGGSVFSGDSSPEGR